MTTNENKEVERIMAKYAPKQITKLDELKALDKKVKRPIAILAYIVGILGALVLGTGMCFAMEVIGDAIALGVAIGCVGLVIISVNYYLYEKLLKARKNKYAAEIKRLSDEALNA